MSPSSQLIPFIKTWEGCKLTAYQDIAGVWTIGFGSTMYKSGARIKEGDEITMQQAEELLMWELALKGLSVQAFTLNTNINQNQFDALSDFAYNCGVGALEKSTLLKIIRLNPADPDIRAHFLEWKYVKKNGVKVISEWQVRRRTAEADLYFKS